MTLFWSLGHSESDVRRGRFVLAVSCRAAPHLAR